ncbi:hypothetical protein FS837_000940, partial [Tulasnella sp. UAMH 9824]
PRKYAEFLKLAREALQRKPDVFGKAQWGRVMRLGNTIVSSGRLRIRTSGAMTEECQNLYHQIESALSDVGFLKQLNPVKFSDNPADPPSVQVVQAETGTSNPGGDTATPECNTAISSQEEGVQGS